MLATQAPFPQYFDIDGDPLDAGYLYFGTASLNPETNPVAAYWDAAGTQPAAQPIRTLNGFAARNGTPALVYVNSDYAINVRNKKGALIYYAASAASFSNTLALSLSLADTTSGANGAGLSGFNGSLNYVGLTVGARLLDVGASPRSLGAVGDGVADDTAFIVAALLYSKTLDLRNRSWKITSTVTLPAGTVIDMRGANIVAACGATPIFQFLNGNAGLTILHSGGQVTGTASCFLFAQGKINTPALQSDYASQIHIDGLWINSATITTSLVFDKAVKSAYIHGANFFTPNGISASGKCVEVMISDSILFSATGIAGTSGIKLRSTGGGNAYNEGWSIVNCTVDNYEISHDVTDIFVYQITGGYHGVNAALAATSGYVLQLQAPSTNLCEEIAVGGGAVFSGRTRFAASAGGQAYHANLDATFINTSGVAIAIENNAANITIRGKWKNGGGTAIGVLGSNNNPNIVVSGDFDGTYSNGVILNGANGANCVIGPLSGSTINDIVGAARLNIRYVGIPVHSTGVASLVRQSIASNISGAFAVAATIASLAVSWPKGGRGRIIINLPYSGANAATQNVQVNPPAGVNLIGGSGFSAQNLFLGAASGLLHAHLDFYCTADISGTLSVINQAGNALTINNQAYIAVILES